MIDIHCHILPGMDDGPESLDEAVEMCRIAAAEGVETIVAAPHFRPGTYEFIGLEIMEAIEKLKEALKNNGVGIRILPGAEVTVSPEMFTNLKVGRDLTINHGRYFLAEFAPLSVPTHWDDYLLSFLDVGLTPIIAHPERNVWFIRHPEALAAAVQRGILVQITAKSITGGFGSEARDFSVHLLRNNLVHAIASDGHSADLRPPQLAEAIELASDVVGSEQAQALVTTMPRAIVEGKPLPERKPLEYYPPIIERNPGWFQRLMQLNIV